MMRSVPITFVLAVISTLIFLLYCGGVPGFRDGAHFYGPLFEFLQCEFAAGRFPLWNPYENLGQPFAANPTNLAFYPPLLLTLGLSILTGQDAATAYRFFMLGHVLLAMATCYRLARHWRCHPEAATFAAIIYALSGNVLFQWHNAPFLIGAAWFPEALRQADLVVQKRRGRAMFTIVGLAAILALMTLGGDVQAAYHLGLCAIILVAVRLNAKDWGLALLAALFRLSLSALLAFGFAAVLILPALEFAALSDRSLASHSAVVLQYSVPLWRLLEFFWPNAGGWQFPVNARWASGVAVGFTPEYGIWTPSHYMGLFTLPLALIGSACCIFRRCPQNRRGIALGLLLLLFLLGGLGYGFGIYNLFYRFLPGYSMFRYPAKLFTVVSLLLAIFAAWGFDLVHRNPKKRGRFVVALALLPTLAGIGVFWAFQFGGCHVPNCPLFGPYQPEVAWWGLTFSAVCVLLLTFFGLLTSWPKKIVNMRQTLMLALVTADLFVANTWLLAPVEMANHPSSVELAQKLKAENPGQVAPIRIYRFPLFSPPHFAQTSSPDRIAEAQHWERATLMPRFSLVEQIAVVNVRGTMMHGEYRQEIQRIGKAFSKGKTGEFEIALERLGVQYILKPEQTTEPEMLPLEKSKRNYVHFEPDRLVFDIVLEKPETVVLQEQFWPGWQACDEHGQRFSVVCVDKIFRGVELPAGKHRITLVYRPARISLGLAITILSIAMAGLVLMSNDLSRFELG